MGWWYNFCQFCRNLYCQRGCHPGVLRQYSRCLIITATFGLILYIMFCPSFWIILMLLLLVSALLIC